jgi:hypothetical protein
VREMARLALLGLQHEAYFAFHKLNQEIAE